MTLAIILLFTLTLYRQSQRMPNKLQMGCEDLSRQLAVICK